MGFFEKHDEMWVEPISAPPAPKRSAGGNEGTLTKREALVGDRIEVLIRDFERYLHAFDEDPAFRKYGQLENHVATITRRRQLGSAVAAIWDAGFLRLLHQTLNSWGIGQRGSKLLDLNDFVKVIRAAEPGIGSLEGERLDDPSWGLARTEKLWNLVDSLRIVENEAKLVPCTKALHHLLPEVFVPMDRAYTRVFFGWYGQQFQYQQKKVFYSAYEHFARIAREANPHRFVGGGWRTSLTKNIDNALVGFCRLQKLPRLS